LFENFFQIDRLLERTHPEPLKRILEAAKRFEVLWYFLFCYFFFCISVQKSCVCFDRGKRLSWIWDLPWAIMLLDWIQDRIVAWN